MNLLASRQQSASLLPFLLGNEMFIKKLFIAAVSSFILSTCWANGGVQLDRSRILINEGKTTGSFAVQNHYKLPLLASAVITNFDGTPTNAFAVSPNLFQVKPEGTFQSQVVQLDKLPQDKESVFWLTVRTVLAADKNEETNNSVQFAIAQAIKIFYRPKSVKETCASAVTKVQWIKTESGIRAKNNSRVAISLVNISDGDDEMNIGDTLLPLQEKEWKVNSIKLGEMKITYVDEYGNFLQEAINIK